MHGVTTKISVDVVQGNIYIYFNNITRYRLNTAEFMSITERGIHICHWVPNLKGLLLSSSLRNTFTVRMPCYANCSNDQHLYFIFRLRGYRCAGRFVLREISGSAL